jgi:predicted HicB family RNase H-like nuclease
METTGQTTTVERGQEAVRVATQMYEQRPDWVTFFREILGVGGVVRRLFPEVNDFKAFEKTPQFAEIQKLLIALRESGDVKAEATQEPTRVITVRLPMSLHESLRAEAHSRHTSINKLCISKLLQVIDDEPTVEGEIKRSITEGEIRRMTTEGEIKRG